MTSKDTIPEAESKIDPAPYVLLRSENAAVGRIIIAAAELEHVLTIALFTVTGIEPVDGYILFAKDTIGGRLGKLRSALRYKAGEEDRSRKFEDMRHDLNELVALRNMFAHGVQMGVADGFLHFQVTKDPKQLDNQNFKFLIQRVRLSELHQRAWQCEILVLRVRDLFGVNALHERYVLKTAIAGTKREVKAST